MDNYLEKISYEFNKSLLIYSDICEHLLVLKELACEVKHVTEFGVRSGNSTRAFLLAQAPTLRSYDIELDATVIAFFEQAKQAGFDAIYEQADTLTLEIDATDLLFIDTWHTYQQLSQELQRHAKKVKKYIVLHDTVSFAWRDESRANHLMPLLEKATFFDLFKCIKEIKLSRLPSDKFTKIKTGLVPAVLDFLQENQSEWKIKIHRANNNGLTVLERIAS